MAEACRLFLVGNLLGTRRKKDVAQGVIAVIRLRSHQVARGRNIGDLQAGGGKAPSMDLSHVARKEARERG